MGVITCLPSQHLGKRKGIAGIRWLVTEAKLASPGYIERHSLNGEGGGWSRKASHVKSGHHQVQAHQVQVLGSVSPANLSSYTFDHAYTSCTHRHRKKNT